LSIGKICVPFDPKEVHKFKVDDVPTLTSVINDLGTRRGPSNSIADKGTASGLPSMEVATKVFRNFLKQIDAEND
jgi:hypothetical protein